MQDGKPRQAGFSIRPAIRVRWPRAALGRGMGPFFPETSCKKIYFLC